LQGITFSDDLESAEQIIPSEELLSAWKTLTSIGVKEKGVIQEYGISEMSTERLEAFLGQLTELPKPSVDHINAADCCALPPGLISLSKQQNIKLIAHHDSEEILSKSELQEICSSRLDKSCAYDLQWVLRLTFIVRDRQVLTGNEYLVGVKKIAV
jgi:glutamate--cysteine ligase regulatory subunit